MAKSNPYHTDSLEYRPEHWTVYHDHDNCPEGKKILDIHREYGTGGKERCKECINSVKTAVFGKPLPTSGRSVHSSQECTKPAECRGSEGHGRGIFLGHATLPLVCHGT